MKLNRIVMISTVFLFLGVSVAQASPITTLYNTGVDASGVVLANGVIGDPHYSLISVPGGTSTIMTRTSAGGYPIGPWLADDALSVWIGPANNSQLNGPVGDFIYRTSFDLTGFNPLSASITGKWATDNPGTSLLLNGIVAAGMTTTGYTVWSPFILTSGFIAGINTLDFVVRNNGGPTGLRVEMTGDASAAIGAVPEPATLALFGLGLMGVALGRRRKH